MSKDCNEYILLMKRMCSEMLEPEEQGRLDEHVASCSSCRTTHSELVGTLEFFRLRKEPTASEEYFDTFYQRLEERIDARGVEATLSNQESRLRQPWVFLIRNKFRLAGAFAILVIGILVGRTLQPGIQVADVDAIPSEQLSLKTEIADYLDQSQVLLLGFANMDEELLPSIGRQQAVARELVDRAPYIKSGLTRSSQHRLRELIEDLEVVLMQIANLEATVDDPALEIVLGGIDGRGLLLKLNMAELSNDVQRTVDDNEVVPLEQFQ